MRMTPSMTCGFCCEMSLFALWAAVCFALPHIYYVTVQASEQRVVWSWKAFTLITDFTNLVIAVHSSHELVAVIYGSCCTL